MMHCLRSISGAAAVAGGVLPLSGEAAAEVAVPFPAGAEVTTVCTVAATA